MASTSALFIGLSGMNANARNLDVIGNNISNANTTAFKSSRMLFSTMFSRTFTGGSAPSDTSGGTNPFQTGLGVNIAGTQRDFRNGTISTTGDARDLAIEGDGFFIVDRGGSELYTRAGAFRQNSEGELVTIDGDRLQGYGVDADFNITGGELGPIAIPIGSLTIAESTSNVGFTGNLNAAGDLPTQGSSVRVGGTATAGLGLISAPTVAPSGTNVIEGTSLLVEIEDPLLPGSDTPLFSAGQIVELSGAAKGTRAIDDARFTIGAGSTVAELMAFLGEALGLQTGLGPNPDGALPGVDLDPATGLLTVTGNTGAVNDLTVETADIRLLESDGSFTRLPFVSAKLGEADGESVRTSFVAYDSLGSEVQVDLSLVMDSKDSTGTSWRYYVESGDDSDTATAVATGLLEFDTSGRLVGGDDPSIVIDRAGTGAETPLSMTLSFEGEGNRVTALADTESSVTAEFQDGSPIGTLSGFGVGPDGVITGAFTNGLTRTIGQVAMATFANNEGLVEQGANLYAVGANSGTAVVTTPGALGAGRLVGGALELSNVDLGQEFINMILASTGYSASSRVIRTTDELIQQLLVLGR